MPNLETLIPTGVPIEYDPFNLLLPEEREQMARLLDHGVPRPNEIGPSNWLTVRWPRIRPVTVPVRTDPVLGSRRYRPGVHIVFRYRCDLHPARRGRWLVVRAPSTSEAIRGTILCNQCHTRRVRYSSFQWLRLPDEQRNPHGSTHVDLNSGLLTCSDCAESRPNREFDACYD